MIKNNPLELYFHIPFCVSKCNYCDFLSGPAGSEEKERYMSALLAETCGKSRTFAGYEVTSVFIGGGTPSIVPVEGVERLLAGVKAQYRMASDAELTMEINPGTAGYEALCRYREAGINRLSIGLQSARDEELRRLGRIHTYGKFLDTYREARAAGFTNINVDLMSALPGQTCADYRGTLQSVLGLMPPPEHISAYSLIVEEGTPFGEQVADGVLALPDEESERRMYEETGLLLGEAGYRRYEISNYARSGYECRHNTGYWKRVDYRGFGLGAASLIGRERFSNTRDMDCYLMDPLNAEEAVQRLTTAEEMEETLFLGLRMAEGIEENAFLQRFGRSLWEIYGPVIEKNVQDGLLTYRDGRLCPTPRGFDLNNYLGAQFLLE